MTVVKLGKYQRTSIIHCVVRVARKVKIMLILKAKKILTGKAALLSGYANNAKYCSRSCLAKARRHNAHPKMTAPEKAFMNICKKYLFPFKFVGNGALWLGNANPDFVHNTKKIVVEVFGDYWHSPLLNGKIKYKHTIDGRRKQLKAEGYKTIFIWESDLKRKDAEAFVIRILKKEKII
jgi:G:T-mismatch repair DNA endonuclease (very short patch repair protein)